MFRSRPHWYALTFEYGLGLVAVWHLVEDLFHGQWKVYSGDYYPWRRVLPMNEQHYALLVLVESVALACFFARIRPRFCAAVIGTVLFIDNLGSYLNHRLLMSLEFFLLSLVAVPNTLNLGSLRMRNVYWNLDLVRYQLTLVYVAAALHKLNSEFLSGTTLSNLFWMTHHHGMKTYPAWLFNLLQRPDVCVAMAWSVVAVELMLAIGLNFRRTVGAGLILAIVFHVAMAILMGYIKIFTALVIVSLIVFLPDRTFGEPQYVLTRRNAGTGPRLFLIFVWPGYVVERLDPEIDTAWELMLPNGIRTAGFGAWVELLSLSPLTFLPAESLRLFSRRAGE
jgi:hypothetical protein